MKKIALIIMAMIMTAASYSIRNELRYLVKQRWFDLTGYVPHEGQEAIHRSESKRKVAVCGRRFGKSLLAAKEAELTMMVPGSRVWVVAPTYKLSDKVFREVWKTFVIDQRSEAVIKKSESERVIHINNGSIIEGKSCDNPDSLLGEKLDLLIFDECAQAKESIWHKYLAPTLLDSPEAEALFITTPEGQNWVYRLYLNSGKHADWDGFHYATRHNPHISEEQINKLRDEAPSEEYFNQQIEALFSVFVGKMFPDWDATHNVIHAADMPTEYDEYLYGYDDGYSNPAAFVVIGILGEYAYVIDEVYKSHMSEGDKLKEMARLQKKYSGKGYADSAAPQIIKAYRDAGYKIYKANKSVKEGVQALNGKFKALNDGSPRLFVSSKCENLIKELSNYRHKDQREEPIKKDDHAVDALRYAIYNYYYRPAHKALKGDNILC